MAPYRVLIIAPNMGLSTLAEILSASSGFEPSILSGTVTRERALVEIGSGRHDIIYFGTHGQEHSLQMSDGIIEEDMLEHAVRQANNIRLLFINACRSAHTAAEVYNNTNVLYVIGWPFDVSDSLASLWARLFFEALRMEPANLRGASSTASESVIKSHHIDPDEVPIVLNGRIEAMVLENKRLQEAMRQSAIGVWRVPNWMVILNVSLVISLIAVLMILAAMLGKGL